MAAKRIPPARRQRRGGRARTQAERRAASQRRLLDVTAELIAERGTSGVGFGEIAKAAGCSHGLPSYLFGTKAGLLQALVDDFADRLKALTDDPAVATATGLDALVRACGVFVRVLARPSPEMRAAYVLVGEALGTNQALRTALDDYDAAMRATVVRWIVEGVESGEIRPEVDPDLQATVILGAMRGIGHQVVANPTAYDLDALRTEMMGCLLHMLATDPDRARTRWGGAGPRAPRRQDRARRPRVPRPGRGTAPGLTCA